jgi:hypothetical protein
MLALIAPYLTRDGRSAANGRDPINDLNDPDGRSASNLLA